MRRPYQRNRNRHEGRNARFGGSRSPGIPGTDKLPSPWAVVKHAQPHPHVWRSTVRGVDPSARPGDLVNVFDSDLEPVGLGLFAPKSNVQIRMISWDVNADIEAVIRNKLEVAIQLRKESLKLDSFGDCYRLVHGEGDGLSGLIVDKLGEVISIEVFTQGWLALMPVITEVLKDKIDCNAIVVGVDKRAKEAEGFQQQQTSFGNVPKKLTVTEHGLKFRVNLATGHKTGFFCDQRDNRLELRRWVEGRDVLDVCTYTGGFAINAAAAGASSVTGVDLDEKALAVARTNSGLNQSKITWKHADAFGYLRQMGENDKRFGVVVLDPPKFIPDKKTFELGRRKYYDLNKLGAELVENNGILLTCSCSGMLSRDELLQTVQRVQHASRNRIRLRLLKVTGAGEDHPVQMNCLQSEYLKAAWFSVMRDD